MTLELNLTPSLLSSFLCYSVNMCDCHITCTVLFLSIIGENSVTFQVELSVYIICSNSKRTMLFLTKPLAISTSRQTYPYLNKTRRNAILTTANKRLQTHTCLRLCRVLESTYYTTLRPKKIRFQQSSPSTRRTTTTRAVWRQYVPGAPLRQTHNMWTYWGRLSAVSADFPQVI